MHRLIAIILAALMLTTTPVITAALTPALAQDTNDATGDTADDGTDDGTGDATSDEGLDAQGNFSRNIPDGLKANLSEAEIAAYQARLDAAQTPQERNAIRQELQRTNQERHLAKVQAGKQEQQQNKPQKGFFESMRDDFKDVVSGKAAKDAKAAKASDDANKKLLGKNATNGKAGDKNNNKGGNSGGNSGSGGKKK